MERNNLYDAPEHQDMRSKLETWMDERHADEWYEPSMPFGDEIRQNAVYEAFFRNDSYIVPWGCTTITM